jgi:hypothetical protein
MDKDLIKTKLAQIASSIKPFDRPKMTFEIKKLFSSLFFDKYEVYSNKMGENKWDLVTDEKEFLFDLIVVEETDSDKEKIRFVNKTVLTLETEFEQIFKSVIYDFQKLLVANSDIKVIAFRCHSNDLHEYLDYMKKNIKVYKPLHGEYYFVSYLNDKLEFSFGEICN